MKRPKDRICWSHHKAYVSELFCSKTKTKKDHKIIWALKTIFQFSPHFKYSTRVISALVASATCTYQLGAVSFYLTVLIIRAFRTSAESHLQAQNLTNNSSELKRVKITLKLIEVSFGVTNVIIVLLFIYNLFDIALSYKKCLHTFASGRWREILKGSLGDSGTLTASCLRYSGYQIAFLLWGYIVINATSWIICLFISFVIILPITNGNWEIVKFIAEFIGVPALTALALKIFQLIVSKKFILQQKLKEEDEDQPLAILRRSLFHMMSYVFFIANVNIGLASTLMRALKGLAIGIFWLGRIDKAVLMRDYETLDGGYQSYLGMVALEHNHNNPILRCFCQILFDSQKYKSKVEAEEPQRKSNQVI